MNRQTLLVLLCASGIALPGGLSGQQGTEAADAFATASLGAVLEQWSGSVGSAHLDSTVFRSAPRAGRLERTAASPGQNAVFNLVVPVTFSGSVVELRGWLRTEDVADWAGLWLRQDGEAGSLALENMSDRGVAGTTEWTRYTIRLPLEPGARRIHVGALLVGEGTVWVDDLELLVDGAPAAEASPAAPRMEDLDRTFDDGSGVATQPLTDLQAANLALLGRVWGFVKYHHPAVTGGDVHWDYALFHVLPEVLAAPDKATAVAAMDAWLEGLGEPAPCQPCARPPDRPHLQADHTWIADRELLGPALSARLTAIHRSRPADGDHHYVGHAPAVGNPNFASELAYPAMEAADAGYRLLGLFRFWNIVQYWFPYRDVIGEDWVGVLRSFVPVFMAGDDATAYRLAMMQLVARIHDTHANLWSDLDVRPPVGTAHLPLVLRFVEGQAAVTGYTHPELGPGTGLLPGDVIQRLDGAAVDSLVSAWRPYYAASNEPTRLRDMARSLGRGEPGPVRLTVQRADSTFEVMASRVPSQQLAPGQAYSHDRPGPTFQRLTPEVAYLKLSSVVAEDAADHVRQAEGAEVLVIDIRNYPSEFVVFALGGHLVAEPTPFARFTRADPANPGAFRWGSVVSLQPLTPRFEGKVVILVDETS